MDDVIKSGRGPRRQFVLLAAIFAAAVAVLALGYYLFLRTDYAVLAQGIRPAEAQAIVKELDQRGIAYRLRDGGSTVLVPESEVDATRVAIAGSDAAASGQIGFELFNKSDMGLTNFAQKINYQRALQGELVRTIMAMDGVESARVHLALPERTLFRGDRAEPKAAVTVAMKPGQTADPARVAGIQQLVAAAVPDLPEAKVVVLDSAGHVISAEPAAQAGIDRPADLEERAAVEGYYRARARGAIERGLPGVKFALKTLVFPQAHANAATPETAPAEWSPSGEGAARNFRIRMLLVTEAPLGADDRNLARDAVVQATGIDEARGDELAFETGPTDQPVAVPVVQPAPAAAAPVPSETAAALAASWPGDLIWLAAAIALAVAVGVALFLRSRATRLDGASHDAFAAKLRRQLGLEDEADAAA